MSAPDLTEPSVSTAGATLESSIDRVADAAARHERLLWGVVVVALVGDVLLTAAGLANGHTEGNPVMAGAIETLGFAALGLTKVVVLGIAGFYRELRPEYGAVIALGLAIPWLIAVVVNASLLY